MAWSSAIRWPEPGLIGLGQALRFDGDQDSIFVQHGPDLAQNDLSVSLWVKLDELAGVEQAARP